MARLKKESTRRKKPDRRKSSAMWDCKINGCNKQFAREADLKRHQRTTKVHSVPGFTCPQCDATFTRTDALKRHQKSRHFAAEDDHEMIVEDNEPVPEPSSRSSSSAPSSKGKEKESDPPAASFYYRRPGPYAISSPTERCAPLPISSTRSDSPPEGSTRQYPPYYRPNSEILPRRLSQLDGIMKDSADSDSEPHSRSSSVEMETDPASPHAPLAQQENASPEVAAARSTPDFKGAILTDVKAHEPDDKPVPADNIPVDGTPMLNPAELLTPESLESPHPT